MEELVTPAEAEKAEEDALTARLKALISLQKCMLFMKGRGRRVA